MLSRLDPVFDRIAVIADEPASRVAGMSVHAWALLLLITCAALIPGLASVPVMDRDEARYAQASKQMLETGDFVDIRFQDVPRHVKPVGTYWFQAATASLAGGPEKAEIWAYRLPSFIGAVVAVVVTAWLGAKIGGGTVGLTAGLLMAVSLIMSVEARTAKTDALLLASVVIAQAALWTLLQQKDKPRFRGAALLFWVAHGVGVLIKGDHHAGAWHHGARAFRLAARSRDCPAPARASRALGYCPRCRPLLLPSHGRSDRRSWRRPSATRSLEGGAG